MRRTIKRYENRKLYDTESRKYVSLEEIARLIRQGIEVEVVDNKTATDITAQTLTQVILEEGKKGRHLLSSDTLHEVIRWGSTIIDDGVRQVRQRLDHIPESVARFFNKPRPEELDELKKRIDHLEQLIEKLAEEKTDQKSS